MKNILKTLNSLSSMKMSRRQFMKTAAAAILFSSLGGKFMKRAAAATDTSSGRPKKGIKGNYDLVMADGPDPYVNTVEAVKAMGGMEKFVPKNATVVIKPNIGWDRVPDQAANTDPMVVAALVDMSFKAGAKRVNVFDITCNEARRCYENSGIKQAAQSRGAQVYYPDLWNVAKAQFSYPSTMQDWPVLKDALECDTFINVPVLKNHALTGLTLSMKNLMGVCGANRGVMHTGIGPRLVDITDFISPELTVIDAHRVLTRNGPSGGNINDVITLNKLLVSTDPTLADMVAAKLVNVEPSAIPYIKNAIDRKFGITDMNSAKMLKIKTA